MKNHLYYNEMVAATEYLKTVKNTPHLKELKKEMRNPLLTHSDKWSLAFDYFKAYNLDTKYVTGFVYSQEGGM